MSFDLGFHERAAVVALLAAPHSREQLDRVARCSNSPNVVMKLRRRGIEISTQRVVFEGPSGRKSWHGRYELSSEGRQRARELLGNEPEGNPQ